METRGTIFIWSRVLNPLIQYYLLWSTWVLLMNFFFYSVLGAFPRFTKKELKLRALPARNFLRSWFSFGMLNQSWLKLSSAQNVNWGYIIFFFSHVHSVFYLPSDFNLPSKDSKGHGKMSHSSLKTNAEEVGNTIPKKHCENMHVQKSTVTGSRN